MLQPVSRIYCGTRLYVSFVQLRSLESYETSFFLFYLMLRPSSFQIFLFLEFVPLQHSFVELDKKGGFNKFHFTEFKYIN